uniref:T-cell surface glycoprotein CD3 zeta chain n=1 Tax=Xiphophorus maculatus TaxID=8083 RepID=A0A3B5R7Q7_XIPMA
GRLCSGLGFSLACFSSETKALDYSDPKLCYVLDGFLGLYGLIITGMFIKEKVEQNHSDLLDVYLTASAEERAGLPGEYQPDRSDPSNFRSDHSATRDTYDSLQMQPLPAR